MLVLAAGLTICPAAPATANEASVLERIQGGSEPFDSPQVDTVRELTGRTVTALERYRGGSFKVMARKEYIKRYRCGVCHTKKKVLVQDGALFTHGDIKINHGRAGRSLVCTECHHAEDRDFLADSQGRKIDFDHSYELCGKCHFRQKRDWIGGAHGKRESYWAGERVVRNCTGCHNPHSPAFPEKMPATYSLPLDE